MHSWHVTSLLRMSRDSIWNPAVFPTLLYPAYLTPPPVYLVNVLVWLFLCMCRTLMKLLPHWDVLFGVTWILMCMPWCIHHDLVENRISALSFGSLKTLSQTLPSCPKDIKGVGEHSAFFQTTLKQMDYLFWNCPISPLQDKYTYHCRHVSTRMDLPKQSLPSPSMHPHMNQCL